MEFQLSAVAREHLPFRGISAVPVDCGSCGRWTLLVGFCGHGVAVGGFLWAVECSSSPLCSVEVTGI